MNGRIDGPAPGTRLGPYVLEELLGVGGMGFVYRARDVRLDRDVALEVLRPEVGFACFEREAKAVAALSHPNIVAIHDYGEDGGLRYLVSELLEGRTLRESIPPAGFPARRALEYAIQIAHGLAAAHDKGIVHRDLKPENVYITRDGRAKLLDFGIARAPSATEPLTGPGRAAGTLGYRSPEQASGAAATPASNLFSFGAILYEMLSGRRAFGGESATARLRASLAEEPPPLSSTAPQVPAALAQLVARCLEKRPEDRFQSARDVAFALEAIARQIATSRPASPGAVRRRARRAATLAAAAFFLASAGFVGHRLGSRASPPPESIPVVTLRTLSYSGRDLSPAPSPDGRLIAFRSDRDGRPRIWLRQTASGEEHPLTSGPDDYPRFSPDGASILFTRTPGRAALYRVPTLGGEPRRVLEDASDGDFAPDGSRIAFIRWYAGAPRLLVAASDGSGEREILDLDLRVRACPRFSPDGTRIAVTGLPRKPGSRPSITIARLDGGEPQRIPAPGAVGYVSCVSWLPEGRLAYVQAEGVREARSPGRLFIHDLADGTLQPVLATPSMSLNLDVVGPRGLLFDTRSAQQNLREIRVGSPSSERWLTRGVGTNRQPVYSPDGRWIAFSSNQSGNLDLWAVSPSSGTIRRITDHPAQDWDPAFTPDGQILWSSDRAGHFEIWRAAADGSGARRVTHDGVHAENPSATRDGWVVYASGHPAQPGIWKVRLEGGGAMRLVPGAILPEASPDSRHVLYQRNRGPRRVEVGVARIEDGAKVFELAIDVYEPTLSLLGRPRWTPDGRRIVFIGQDARGRNGLFVQDFVPGKDTRGTRRALAGFEEDAVIDSFAISPDATRLAVARWEQDLTLVLATGVPGIDASRSE